MSNVRDVGFHIVRDSMELGSVCMCGYRYTLLCEPQECDSDARFEVSIELWGNDGVISRRLGHASYDAHTLSGKRTHEVSRSFVVPCEILNEEIGEDKIHIQVCVTGPLGRTSCYASPIVKDRF